MENKSAHELKIIRSLLKSYIDDDPDNRHLLVIGSQLNSEMSGRLEIIHSTDPASMVMYVVLAMKNSDEIRECLTAAITVYYESVKGIKINLD